MKCGRLEKKVAIITGATSGIGKTTTELFAEEGAKVVFAARREELGRQFEADLRKKGFEATFVRADVAKEEDLRNLVTTALDTYGQIDILFNNAGISRPPCPCHEMDMEKDFDFLFDVNLRSYFALTKRVIPHMLKAGKGSVVNTASVAAEIGVPMCSTYAAVKGAIKQMTKSLAAEYATRGIRFNAVLPGTVLTELLPKGDVIKDIVATIPMKRLGTAEEIAAGVLFLASDEASYCTGTMLLIDGGLSAV